MVSHHPGHLEQREAVAGVRIQPFVVQPQPEAGRPAHVQAAHQIDQGSSHAVDRSHQDLLDLSTSDGIQQRSFTGGLLSTLPG